MDFEVFPVTVHLFIIMYENSLKRCNTSCVLRDLVNLAFWYSYQMPGLESKINQVIFGELLRSKD